MTRQLTTSNHDRDAADFTYVYPVVSRRAGGVSVGINLNPNNACNWHCAYCQVPNLVRGVAPAIDMDQLRRELADMFEDILHGSFMAERVSTESRQLSDVAISGNGEPTSCAAFDQVVAVVVEVMGRFALQVPLRLITNGSYVNKPHVRRGLQQMAENHGEVWIKVDSVADEGITRINGVKLDQARLHEQVKLAASLCPSWIQTCMFNWDGKPPSETEVSSYLAFLTGLMQDVVPLKGVLLYGLARPSLQGEAVHLTRLDEVWMQMMAERIRWTGFEVKLSL